MAEVDLGPSNDLDSVTLGTFVEARGPFGQFGYEVPSEIIPILEKFTEEFITIRESEGFMKDLEILSQQWLGRPTPLHHARRLSRHVGGGQIYLKREDLVHTGVHKINHCLGEALLAKHMGKSRIVSETSGLHGVCLANAAACVGIPCEIYIGANDWTAKKHDILRMRMLGATVSKVSTGAGTLKDAADKAFDVFIQDSANTFYASSTVAGPQPFPNMVKDLQAVVGEEAREQIKNLTNRLPDYISASIAGGSNALGIFQHFLTDEEIQLHAVDHELPEGNAVNLTNPGAEYIKGFTLLRDMEYVATSAREAAEAFVLLARHEGVMANWEACAALAQGIKMAESAPKDKIILVYISGRADAVDIAKVKKHCRRSFDDEEEPPGSPNGAIPDTPTTPAEPPFAAQPGISG